MTEQPPAQSTENEACEHNPGCEHRNTVTIQSTENEARRQLKRGQDEDPKTHMEPPFSTENEARDAEQFLRERDEQAAYVTHLEESIKVKDGALSIAAEENRRLTVALSDTEAKLRKLQQEQEHPFDASEFKALHDRAEAAEAKLREYEEALRQIAENDIEPRRVQQDGTPPAIYLYRRSPYDVARAALARSNGEEK